MQSDLKIKRGLFKNTINVDGEDYKVNEGYLKPASVGFMTSAGASIFGNILFRNKIGIAKSLGVGALGAIAGAGVTEAKVRQIQNIFNKDPESAKSLAKKGFSIRGRILDSNTPKLEWLSNIIRDKNFQLGEEFLKQSSMSESSMMRQLDETEDNASFANATLEGSSAIAILADTSDPSSGKIPSKLKIKAPLVIPLSGDKYSSGTRHYSIDEFKRIFPRTWNLSKSNIKKQIEEHGAIVVSQSDINSSSFLREASRAINRSKLMSALSNIPEHKVVKTLNKANTVYSFMASGDDHAADAAAGVQFAMHAPRSFEDISATIHAGKLDKKSIIKNTIFASSRALPMLVPLIGRVIRKNQDS